MVNRSTSSFGLVATNWQQRINWEQLRKYRLNRAREAMKRHNLGAILAMYEETSATSPAPSRRAGAG